MIEYSVDTTQSFIDNISISPGFNANLTFVDSVGTLRWSASVQFILSDSSRCKTFRAALMGNSSGESYTLLPDSAVEIRPGLYRLALYVIEDERSIDSSEYVAVITQVPLDIDRRQKSQVLNAAISAYPNPADNLTVVSYRLAESSPTTIRLYDVLGRLVRTLHDGIQSMGEHAVIWNRRDRLGRVVTPGVYLVVLRTPEIFETFKIVVSR